MLCPPQVTKKPCDIIVELCPFGDVFSPVDRLLHICRPQRDRTPQDPEALFPVGQRCRFELQKPTTLSPRGIALLAIHGPLTTGEQRRDHSPEPAPGRGTASSG